MVLLEPVRSAEPPKNSGSAGAISLSVACDDWRVACGALCRKPGGERLGSGLPPVGGQLAAHAALELRGQLPGAPCVAREQLLPRASPPHRPAALVPGGAQIGGNLEGAYVPAELLRARRPLRRRPAPRRALLGYRPWSVRPSR